MSIAATSGSTAATTDSSWAAPAAQVAAPAWQSQEQYQQYYNYYQSLSTVPPTASSTQPPSSTVEAQDYSKAWDDYYKAYYGQAYSAPAPQYPATPAASAAPAAPATQPSYGYDMQYGYPNLAAPPPVYHQYNTAPPAATVAMATPAATPAAAMATAAPLGYQYPPTVAPVAPQTYGYQEQTYSAPPPAAPSWGAPPPSYDTQQYPQQYTQQPAAYQQYDKPPPVFEQQQGGYEKAVPTAAATGAPLGYDNNSSTGNKDGISGDSYRDKYPPPHFETASRQPQRGYSNINNNNNSSGSNNNRGYSNNNSNVNSRQMYEEQREDNFRRPPRGDKFGQNMPQSRRGAFNDRYENNNDDRSSFNNVDNRPSFNSMDNRPPFNNNLNNSGTIDNDNNISQYNSNNNNFNEYQKDDGFYRGRGGRGGAYRGGSGGDSSMGYRGRGESSYRGGRGGGEFSRGRGGESGYRGGRGGGDQVGYRGGRGGGSGGYNEQSWKGAGEDGGYSQPKTTSSWEGDVEQPVKRSPWATEDSMEDDNWSSNNTKKTQTPLMDIIVRPSGQSPIVVRRQTLIDQWQSAVKSMTADSKVVIKQHWASLKAALVPEVQGLLSATFIRTNNSGEGANTATGIVHCELHLDDIFLVQSKGFTEEAAIEEASIVLWQMLQTKLYCHPASRALGNDKVPVFSVSRSPSLPVTSLPPFIKAGNTAAESDKSETNTNNNINKEAESNSEFSMPEESAAKQHTVEVKIPENYKADDIFLVIDSGLNEKDQSITILNNTAKFNNISIDYKHEKPKNAPHISQCLITINGQEFEKSEARDYLYAKREAADKAVVIFKESCPQISVNFQKAKEVVKEDLLKGGSRQVDEAVSEFLKQFINNSEEDEIYKFSQSFSNEDRDVVAKVASNLNLSLKQEGKGGSGVLYVFKLYPSEEMKKRILSNGYCAQYKLVECSSSSGKSV